MSFKIERLQQVIRRKVTQVIQRDLADPRLGLITITTIKLARDLSTCCVRYSVLGDEGERSKCAHALQDALGFVQREVAGALRTRTTPRLIFEFDPSIEGSARVAELLRRELDATPGEDGDEDGPPHETE